MAARSIASITISFGMVAIPVKVYSATQAGGTISFNLLHEPPCGSRLRQQYVCIKEDVVVPRENIVKGYEFAKDQYVMFTDEELKALEEEVSRAVEVSEFVPLGSIDPVYFDRAYFLAPDKGGNKPYALFVKALAESGRCAIGRWAARGKQYIVMLRAAENGLVMQQLHYADEVREIGDIDIPAAEVKDAELKLATRLIEQQAADGFDPTAYRDRVKERLEQAIEQKVEGQEIAVAEQAPAPKGQVIDLMEALRASLEKRAPEQAKEAHGKRKAPKRASSGGRQKRAGGR